MIAILSAMLFFLVATCLFITIVQIILQVAFSLLPRYKPGKNPYTGNGLVSIHIASYNEPPQLLINNLNSLKKQSYQNFEVLVLDNNTVDESVWRPVEKFIQKLPDKFKFFHLDKIDGFKAGALNYLQGKKNPAAEYIVTIDADYQVRPDFLETALSYFNSPDVAFVQFPQSYFNTNSANKGVTLEYEHFFHTYMNGANYCGCVNATGTLTIFRTSVLKKIGEYDHKSITEDADMGFRIINSKYKSVYVHEIIGQGFMPYDIEAYKKQKIRWAKGNAMIIKKFFSKLFYDPSFNFKQKAGLAAQLTSWLNFTLVPVLAALAIGIMNLLGITALNETSRFIFQLSSLTIFFFVSGKLSAFVIRYYSNENLFDVLKAFLVHLGMSWVYSISVYRGFFAHTYFFERTNKFILPAMPKLLKNTFFEFCIGLIALSLAVFMLYRGELVMASTFLMVCFMYFSVYYIVWELRYNKKTSSDIMKKIDIQTNE